MGLYGQTCIFQNLIAGLFKTIADFLGALIGKFINAPLCAAEQLVGALLSKLTNELTAAISPILQSLSDTLGGALGSISEIVGQALEVIGLSNMNPNDVKWYIENTNIMYPNAHVRENVSIKYGLFAWPTTFLIDPSGKIIAVNLRGNNLVELVKERMENPDTVKELIKRKRN